MSASQPATFNLQEFTDAGQLLVGGRLYTYAYGTTAQKTAFTDPDGTVPHTYTPDGAGGQYIALNARGELPAPLYLVDGAYDISLKRMDGSTVWTRKADGVENSLLRWIAQAAAALGSSLIGFAQSAAGAVVMTVRDALSERVSVLQFMTAEQRADARSGNPALDHTSAIQAGINFASTIGARLQIPAGVYRIAPATNVTDEASSGVKAAFIMRSNMHIRMDPGTILRVAAGTSSDANPTPMRLFFSDQPLHDLSFIGGALDMNGQSNPISPKRANGVYNRFTQAHICFSGTPGGVAARGDRVHIERVKFLNGPGASCIVMAQSNTSGVALGKGWTIRDCRFENNGLDTDDHSSIFGWADDVLVDGNTFTADTMQGTTGATGGLVAYEVHGANQRFVNNKISNYYQGAWVGANLTSDCDNILIGGNVMSPIRGVGVDFYRFSPAESLIHKVNIIGNTFGLDDSPTAIQLKAAVQLACSYAVIDVVISDNIATKIGTAVGSTFANITPQSVVGQKHDRIVVKDNYGAGFVTGVNLNTNAVNGLGHIEIEDNEFFDLTPAGPFAVPQGIALAGTKAIDHLVIDGNSVIDGRAVPLCQFGLHLTGAVTNLHVKNNKYRGMTVANYLELGFSAAVRNGDFEKVSFTPQWSSGSAITLGNGSTQGSYTQHGDQLTVNAVLNIGTTTVLPGGTLSFTLPVPSGGAGLQYLGIWRMFDASASAFDFGYAEIDGTSTVSTLQVNDGLFATNGQPVALAAGDQVSVQITYSR